MDIQPDQKSAIIVASLAIIVLAVITLVNRQPFRYQDTTDYAKLHEQEVAQQQAYANYLKAIHPDPVASKELFEKLVTPEEVQKQVEAELNIKQTITLPSLSDDQIKTKPGANKQGLVSYFSTVAKLATDYNNVTLNIDKNLFNSDQDPGQIGVAMQNTEALVQTLKQTPVPEQLVKFHKAQILTFDTYNKFLQLAKQYNLNEVADPWSDVYRHYSVINTEMEIVTNEAKRVSQQYQLSEIPLPAASTPARDQSASMAVSPAGRAADSAPSFGLIKPARAQFGNVVIVGNVPEAIREGIKQGLAAAFANFATKFLDKLIAAIEKNYKIANFLYYSDALVKGEYVNDYLDKYVPDPVDRQIIVRFIPQFSCGSKADFKQVFKAKSYQYLGFDPENVDPSDPNFYAKLAKVGDFFASPNGWDLYYQDIAAQAQSQAEKAASQEISSPGLKSARDLVSNQIQKSLASINNAEAAAYIAVLDLGVVNVENIASKIVSSVVTNLFNNFVFKGAIVFKEQETCIPVPQLQPVVPVSETVYQNSGQ